MKSFIKFRCILYAPLLWCLQIITCEKQEICNTEQFDGVCPDSSVILMESALYGRMKVGACVKENYGHLGCTNDVLHLADRWCSGRQSCQITVPNQALNSANRECARELALYMEVEYNCVPVQTPDRDICTSVSNVNIHGTEGYLSSEVTSETGCGSLRSPWIVSVSPGQIIDFWLLDFASLDGSLGVSCQQSLGYISESNLGTNMTICRNQERKKQLYTSKTNNVQVQIAAGRESSRFLIQFIIRGCPDLSPPVHAWYKREDNEAVIGCKFNDRIWRLYCNGNTWDGVVGNCSHSTSEVDGSDFVISLPFTSVIFLTCVVCGAILLIIIVIVAGAVYVKKQSIRHEINLRSEYACMTLSPAQYIATKPLGYDTSLQRQHTDIQAEDNQPLVDINNRTLSILEKPPNVDIIQTHTHSIARN